MCALESSSVVLKQFPLLKAMDCMMEAIDFRPDVYCTGGSIDVADFETLLAVAFASECIRMSGEHAFSECRIAMVNNAGRCFDHSWYIEFNYAALVLSRRYLVPCDPMTVIREAVAVAATIIKDLDGMGSETIR